MSEFTLEDVTYRTNGSSIVQDVSLAVDSGETVALIGPSGAGKTTLLRLAATFERPTTGTVTHDGTDIWAVSNGERLGLRRRIAMVFQEPTLFDASVLRNVRYGRQVRQSWSDRIQRRCLELVGVGTDCEGAREWLDLVGMADRYSDSVGELSSGEAHRVAMARALAIDPDILLLDEPTANLDPRNTAVIEEVVAAAATRETGVLMATHDMAQAQRVADRVAVILDGQVTEVGPTERIFEAPDDPRTERFIEGELVY